ncbi:MAG: ATP-binding protein [Gemmatimonadetes bacterium]|nr:ATP-binding protein [Gemmatimonadota bacterium]
MRDVWAGTRRGMGQCALVTGEAGIGKTRTSTELLRLAVLDGGLVVTYTCGAGDTIAPLSSLLGLTGMLLSQPGALGCGQEHLHYLRRLLHPDPQQPLSSGMTADLAYAQLVYSLSELVSAIAEEAPLVIFIDDAHRLHQTSWRIFTDVTHRLPERSLLLLMAARQLPDFYATLGITGSDGRVRHVRLPSMAQGDAVAFLERWSERNRVPFTPAEVTRFAATAAGNPFYLGELAAHRGRGGSDDAPPSTIRGLIELQFAGLREHAQRVLLVVSLLQSHATLERVTRVLGLTPMEFLSALEELERAGLVLSHSSAIRLRHRTIAEVIQRMASASALTFARIRTAEILEREAHANRDPDLLATASESWELAGSSDRAAEVANTLGELLLSLGLANESSQSHKRAALLASSEKVRRRAKLLLLRALYAANSWASLTEELALLTSSAGDKVDVELSLYQASADYFYRHIPPNPTVVVAALHADGLPDALRAHAGLLAVAAWDESLGTWPLPVEYARVESVAATSASTEARSLQLILAAIGGDGERVQGLTRRVVSTERQTNPALRLRELRHAAYALIRVGSSDQAWEPLSTALSDAARLGLSPA